MAEQSSKAFCERHKISRMTLSRWRNAGNVVVTESGCIDAEATDARLAAAGLGKFRRAAPEQTDGLAEQQRRKEIALARLRMMEWRRREDQCLRREEAEHVWNRVTSAVQARAKRLPAQIASKITSCKHLGEIQGVVRDAVYEALTELAAQGSDYTDSALPPALDVPDDATRLEAQTLKTKALAQLRQAQVDIAKGNLLDANEFENAAGDAIGVFRQRLLVLEGALPPRLLDVDRKRAEKVLLAAVNDALAPLRAGFDELMQDSPGAKTLERPGPADAVGVAGQ